MIYKHVIIISTAVALLALCACAADETILPEVAPAHWPEQTVAPAPSPAVAPAPSPAVAPAPSPAVAPVATAELIIIDEPEPEVTHEELFEKKISEIIGSMTLHEKICQMLIVSPDDMTGVTGTTVAGELTRSALEKYPVGGFIYFPQNISGGAQITSFNSALQEFSTIPMFIAVDEEGGRVTRLGKLGVHSIKAMLRYENDGEETAFENALLLSQVLKEHGFNTNFAPVADVWSNSANTVIGDRAFSTDFELASRLVAAAVRGYRESGVACSLKHYPGHGNTREDSHHSTAYINKSLDELRGEEFKPFIAGIAAGADMVMTGHLIVPELDELPATLSRVLLTDILRNELGFNGVIITDSMAMSAVSHHFSADYVAVTAVQAGVDIILMPVDIDETIAALMDAVECGGISERRIDGSVRRILMLKISMGLIYVPSP